MNKYKDYSKNGDITSIKAFEYYDTLMPVEINFMIGRWRGGSYKTNATLDGLLEESGWFGKEFIDSENVHPLVYFKSDRQNTFILNPLWMYLRNISLLNFAKKHTTILRKTILFLGFIISTKNPKARLRMVEHRGKLSAAMVYDDKAIIDSFRKIDDNTVLGFMDSKELPEPFFFILTREN